MMKQSKSTALYRTPFSRAYWRDAAAELKDVRMLVFAALMVALRVAIKSLAIPVIPPTLYINLGFFVNALGAMIFGPVVAILGAAVSDTLGALLFPQGGGAYFFPFIFVEIAGSLIFALFLYRTRVTATRVILSRFCVNFFVNIILNAPIMWLYYKMVLGKSYVLFQLPQIIKNLALFPLESVLLILFLTVMTPLAYRMGMVHDRGDGLRLRKRQVALLAALVVIGAGCVAGYFVYDYNTSNHAARLSDDQIAEINTSLTDDAEAQGLLSDGQIVVLEKVYKHLKGDTSVTFNVYQTSDSTDLAAAEVYRVTHANKDESLTLVASGSAVLVLDDAESVRDLTVVPAAG